MKHKWSLVLFAIGLLILLYPHIAQFTNSQLQRTQVEEFRTTLDDLPDDDVENLLDRARQYNEEISRDLEGLRDPWGDHQELMTTYHDLGFDDKNMFGAIEIPKLNLWIPIYLGSSEAVLSKGVGQVEGSSLPLGGTSTHTVLAGHRGMSTKAMFRDLDQLYPGDVFYIHTMGETLEYRVTEQEVIYPTDTDSLEIREGKDLATLLTCHPYRHNYQRLLIHGERAENRSAQSQP
ncbi:sortase A [Bhargavaea ginsengi]|uniref:Sortase A n=1 Tax=Bhargavaea ginsengi TaxID=426757 RepID=A0A1H6V284_9BACL|nr:class C sortase [Bhargavaea ginsengi]SEI94720.1 sortase A [Bhargavaea ginsengi]